MKGDRLQTLVSVTRLGLGSMFRSDAVTLTYIYTKQSTTVRKDIKGKG